GHRAFECPHTYTHDKRQGDAPRVNLVEAEQVEDEQDLEIPPDVGETLMIKRMMIAPRKEVKGDAWLRTNIFRTRCTSGGKVCNVIIDGGSCENMVSNEMVDKLGLHCEKNPNPYRIAWFKKGNEVTVDKRCLISFSIGKQFIRMRFG
ncbi:hypothetical protein KI387_026590, partial [Taxus chinensis]